MRNNKFTTTPSSYSGFNLVNENKAKSENLFKQNEILKKISNNLNIRLEPNKIDPKSKIEYVEKFFPDEKADLIESLLEIKDIPPDALSKLAEKLKVSVEELKRISTLSQEESQAIISEMSNNADLKKIYSLFNNEDKNYLFNFVYFHFVEGIPIEGAKIQEDVVELYEDGTNQFGEIIYKERTFRDYKRKIKRDIEKGEPVLDSNKEYVYEIVREDDITNTYERLLHIYRELGKKQTEVDRVFFMFSENNTIFTEKFINKKLPNPKILGGKNNFEIFLDTISKIELYILTKNALKTAPPLIRDSYHSSSDADRIAFMDNLSAINRLPEDDQRELIDGIKSSTKKSIEDMVFGKIKVDTYEKDLLGNPNPNYGKKRLFSPLAKIGNDGTKFGDRTFETNVELMEMRDIVQYYMNIVKDEKSKVKKRIDEIAKRWEAITAIGTIIKRKKNLSDAELELKTRTDSRQINNLSKEIEKIKKIILGEEKKFIDKETGESILTKSEIDKYSRMSVEERKKETKLLEDKSFDLRDEMERITIASLDKSKLPDVIPTTFAGDRDDLPKTTRLPKDIQSNSLKALNEFIQKQIQRVTEDFSKTIRNRISIAQKKFGINNSARIVFDENGILVIIVYSFNANRLINSHCNHCIVTSSHYWPTYVSDGNLQYYIYNFNIPSSNDYASIGVTIEPSGIIRDGGSCQTISNQNIKGSIHETLKNWEKEYGIEDSIFGYLKPIDRSKMGDIEKEKLLRKDFESFAKSTSPYTKEQVEQIRLGVSTYNIDINVGNGGIFKNALMNNNIELIQFCVDYEANISYGSENFYIYALSTEAMDILLSKYNIEDSGLLSTKIYDNFVSKEHREAFGYPKKEYLELFEKIINRGLRVKNIKASNTFAMVDFDPETNRFTQPHFDFLVLLLRKGIDRDLVQSYLRDKPDVYVALYSLKYIDREDFRDFYDEILNKRNAELEEMEEYVNKNIDMKTLYNAIVENAIIYVKKIVSNPNSTWDISDKPNFHKRNLFVTDNYVYVDDETPPKALVGTENLINAAIALGEDKGYTFNFRGKEVSKTSLLDVFYGVVLNMLDKKPSTNEGVNELIRDLKRFSDELLQEVTVNPNDVIYYSIDPCLERDEYELPNVINVGMLSLVRYITKEIKLSEIDRLVKMSNYGGSYGRYLEANNDLIKINKIMRSFSVKL